MPLAAWLASKIVCCVFASLKTVHKAIDSSLSSCAVHFSGEIVITGIVGLALVQQFRATASNYRQQMPDSVTVSRQQLARVRHLLSIVACSCSKLLSQSKYSLHGIAVLPETAEGK